MKRNLMMLAVLIVALLGGYAIKKVTAHSNPADQKAFEAVRTVLAQELNVDPQTITLKSVEAVEWTDSCLGLGGPAESCLQAMTPGFRVTVEHGAAVYEFHTDQTAESIREVK